MNKTKSLLNPLLSFVLIAGIIFFLSVTAHSQIKYNVQVDLNEKALFMKCVLDGAKLYIPMEELALAIDNTVSIMDPNDYGPYFKIKGSKLALIKTGSGKDARLNVKKMGTLSSEVKIIILDGKQRTFLPFEEFVLAMGGTWKYNDATGIYGVTAGGCGACFINEQ
jgi:hypothetical protein